MRYHWFRRCAERKDVLAAVSVASVYVDDDSPVTGQGWLAVVGYFQDDVDIARYAEWKIHVDLRGIGRLNRRLPVISPGLVVNPPAVRQIVAVAIAGTRGTQAKPASRASSLAQDRARCITAANGHRVVVGFCA